MGTYFKEAGYETAYSKGAGAHGFKTTSFTIENGKYEQFPVAENNFLKKVT